MSKETALERHRQIWKGKSDEWLLERLDKELKDKVSEIHRLLQEMEILKKTKDEIQIVNKTTFMRYLSMIDEIKLEPVRQYNLIENKLDTLYRNQEKLLQAIKLLGKVA